MDGTAPCPGRRSLIALAVCLCSFVALPALADDASPPSPPPSVARISFVNGDVAVNRADSGDTVDAVVNAPLMVGDYLTTQDNARAELEFDSGQALRLSADTQLRVAGLDAAARSVQLAQGTIELRVLAPSAAYPQVQTPLVSLTPDKPGAYRITVLADGTTQITVRLGRADIVAGTVSQPLDPGTTLTASGSEQGIQFQPRPDDTVDDFDTWNSALDQIAQSSMSYRYVSADIVGAGDLDAYGQWVNVSGYGMVWSPNVNAGWAPYTDGRWVWEPYYGWTWVAAEPWGWAPYHYGRWFYDNAAGWCWYPERVHAYWRPALVAFFSFGGGGGGFSAGFGNVGWVPLGPNEAIHPWWGERGNRRPVVINNVTNVTTITNVTSITLNGDELRHTYRNFNAPGGVVAVSQRHFAAGNFSQHVVLSHEDLTHVSAARDVLPVVPTQHNLQFSTRPTTRVIEPSAHFNHFVAPPVAPSFIEQRRTLQNATTRQYRMNAMPPAYHANTVLPPYHTNTVPPVHHTNTMPPGYHANPLPPAYRTNVVPPAIRAPFAPVTHTPWPANTSPVARPRVSPPWLRVQHHKPAKPKVQESPSP